MPDSVLVWFRRDLRDHDHSALAEALRRARQVYCVFIFDREILEALPSRLDRRVEFIRESLLELDVAQRRRGGGLIVRHADASREIPRLAGELGVDAVFCNRDYEPQAKARDARVAAALGKIGIDFESFKDQAIFDGAEVLTQAGKPYTVFTPYKNAWLKRLSEDDWSPRDCRRGALGSSDLAKGIPLLAEIGFETTNLQQIGLVPGMSGARLRINNFRDRLPYYAEWRDYPAVKGVSYLSVHLRFGTVSIRELVSIALGYGALNCEAGAASWLSELIWRDFYFMILDHFPHVVGAAFKPEYDAISWEQGETADELFAAWCEARTGYPLIDAAMRQLNSTGFMHNRLRMVVASFLTKDLGIDWRRGEAYFAQQLNDFDLSANNGGWQWAASSGCDAQPYFRIFNPVKQSERFDSEGRFIRRYLPELTMVSNRHIHAPWNMGKAEQKNCGIAAGRDIPMPIVEHHTARQRTLERYAVVKRSAAQ
jgi:deoxyribodipyrimidine photo-lyase